MSFRQIQGKVIKRIEECYSCSGKGCARCSQKGAFEITYQEIWEYAYHDDGSRFPMLDELKEVEINRVPTRKGGGCFITTAVCQTLDKPDNCYELNTLRAFRDSWVNIFHPELVDEYYRTAPHIVAAINAMPTSEIVYSMLWTEYLEMCISNIELGENDLAFKEYVKMMEILKREYL